MANHKSAIKRHRQSLKARDRNRTARTTLRGAVKKVHASIEAGDLKNAQAMLQEAERTIAKAANKNLIHWKNAARRMSRLSALVQKSTAKG